MTLVSYNAYNLMQIMSYSIFKWKHYNVKATCDSFVANRHTIKVTCFCRNRSHHLPLCLKWFFCNFQGLAFWDTNSLIDLYPFVCIFPLNFSSKSKCTGSAKSLQFCIHCIMVIYLSVCILYILSYLLICHYIYCVICSCIYLLLVSLTFVYSRKTIHARIH